MEVVTWDGGQFLHEIEAIEKIKKTFCVKEESQLERLGKKKIPLADLQSKPSRGNRNESMLPWKGYAGFRFVGRKGQEGEFDLVIVTDCNVIIVELKDWNNGKITANGGKWYKNERQMGTSPVKVTQNKAHLLKSKLERYKPKFPRRQVPRIEFLVVMTGDADFSSLPDVDALHTVSLEEFLSLKDIYKFNKRFKPHPESRVLNQYFSVFDLMLKGKEVKPKQLVVHGYEAVEEIFEHPQQLYREYEAINVSRKNDAALLRLWDFNKSEDKTLGTPEGRFEVVSREQEVLNHIKVHDQDLYNRCLRSLTNVQPEDVTTEYAEVYELPFNHTRFNEAVGKYVVNFSESDRYNLVKLLVAKFADLHKLKVAHRDIGDHSIWISPGREIALSGFISAYYPSAKTVGKRIEELSVNSHDAPYGMHQDEHTTPFQIDVYTLAILGWHILQGQRISKNSVQSLIDQVTESSAWYAETFAKAIFATSQDQYRDAIEFYEALNSAEPNNEKSYDFDDIELELYRKNLRLSRTYREDDLIQESAIKEIYRSDSFIVKSWLKIDPDESQPGLGRQVFHFCERLSRLKGLSPDYLPKIHDFGLASRDSCLFLIQEFIEGASWDETNFDDWEQDTKFDLISKLIIAVEHLHNLDEYHGDLKPENIKINWQSKELHLYLIDMPDFSVSGDIPMNHAYSPENIDSCTPQVRDNYAVMRMSYELLGENWDAQEGNIFKYLHGNIEQEKKDYESGFQSLVRFKQALKQELQPKVSDQVVVISCRNGNGLTIYPDNGDLYVNVEIGRNNPSSVMLQLTGVGGSVGLIYSTITKSVEHCLEPRVRDTPHPSAIGKSQFSLPFGIRVDQQAFKDFGDLESQLNASELFQSVVADILSPSSDEDVQASVSTEVTPAIESESVEGSVSGKDSISQVHIDKLWRTILQTETESLPSIEFSGDIERHQGRHEERQLHIGYSSDSDVLEKYDAFDRIEALIVGEDKDITLGEVVLNDSSSEVLCLKKFNNKAAQNLGDGESIYLRTTKDKSSYIRRKKAMERILDKGSIISNLSDYFDPACAHEPIVLLTAPSDEDFSRYDREDDHGNQISLNPQQRTAFKKLLQNGPVSLLQGPPGTGKTEFIAAFSHYLIEKEQVKNILLVSQSHEAVNTAAERIRKHCRKLNTPLDVVRFSNREGAVSDPLRDVYRGSLKTEFRELFIAECKKRVGAFSLTLGVQRAYLEELVDIEFLISSRIQSIKRAQDSLEKDELDDKVRKAFDVSVADGFESLGTLLLEKFSLVLNKQSDLDEIPLKVETVLNERFSITKVEAKRCKALISVSVDLMDVLKTDRVSIDEFYARSRKLVTGTCVGLGVQQIEIDKVQYDWVIIDEAARSTTSELAIAMQSGKRVLLVGDHKQLPPLFSDEHKKAIARKLGIGSGTVELDELLKSDFERAFESPYGKQVGAKLLTQYRMNAPIGNLVSNSFYDGQLENGDRTIPSFYTGRITAPVTWLDTKGYKKGGYHEQNNGSSSFNRAEAMEIIKLLEDIQEDSELVENLQSVVRDNEPTIGVICMYAEQKRLLRKIFREKRWTETFKSMVKIDTVDSYQGKENRVIILSITRNDSRKTPGFLRSPNRINVALSRAMDRLIIVGSTDMWEGKNEDLPLGRVLNYMKTKNVKEGYQFELLTQNGGKGNA